MKKRIQIFIAGAKDLAGQRQQLKAMISDLNHRNEEVNGAVTYSVSSYETFGNNQEEYNDLKKSCYSVKEMHQTQFVFYLQFSV